MAFVRWRVKLQKEKELFSQDRGEVIRWKKGWTRVAARGGAMSHEWN